MVGECCTVVVLIVAAGSVPYSFVAAVVLVAPIGTVSLNSVLRSNQCVLGGLILCLPSEQTPLYLLPLRKRNLPFPLQVHLRCVFLFYISYKSMLLCRSLLHFVLNLVFLEETKTEVVEGLLHCWKVDPIAIC